MMKVSYISTYFTVLHSNKFPFCKQTVIKILMRKINSDIKLKINCHVFIFKNNDIYLLTEIFRIRMKCTVNFQSCEEFTYYVSRSCKCHSVVNLICTDNKVMPEMKLAAISNIWIQRLWDHPVLFCLYLFVSFILLNFEKETGSRYARITAYVYFLCF